MLDLAWFTISRFTEKRVYMSIRLSKLYSLFHIIAICLFATACGEGKRDFVPLNFDLPQDVAENIYLDVAAVKGPLSNAKISFYHVDLEGGEFKKQRLAAAEYFDLLASFGIEYEGGVFDTSEASAEALEGMLDRIGSYGFTTGFSSLYYAVDRASTLAEALAFVDAYIEVDGETNSEYRSEVEQIVSNYSSFEDLKRQLSNVESLGERVEAAESFASISKLVSEMAPLESNELRSSGWSAFESRLSNLIAMETSSSQLIQRLSEFLSFAKGDLALSQDLVAINRLEQLVKDLKNGGAVTSLESLIVAAFREEGNEQFKTEYKSVIASIISVDDAVLDLQRKEALFNLPGFLDLLDDGLDLSTFLDSSLGVVRNHLIQAYSEALVSPKKDAFGVPENRIQQVFSDSRSLNEGVDLGEVSGLIYVEVEAGQQTLDLNSGNRPLVTDFSGLFHTDSIRGYGDNDRQNARVVYKLDGVIQVDENGEVINDPSDLEGEESDYERVYPARFFSPLGTLAVDLIEKKLATFEAINRDAGNNSLIEYDLDDFLFQAIMYEVSDLLIDSFGVNQTRESNLYDAPALILENMQDSPFKQLEALQYRTTIENFSSTLLELSGELNLDIETLISELSRDLLDNTIDGEVNGEDIDSLKSIDYLEYLIRKPPSIRKIAGTNYSVNQIGELMVNQLAMIAPELQRSDFEIDLQSVSYDSPVGGLDEDQDGYPDFRGVLPQTGYSGLWAAEIDLAETIYAGLDGSLSFAFNIEETESPCTSLPCVSLGDASTIVEDSWTVVKSPDQGDMTFFEPDDDGNVGFTARVSVPGEYLVNAFLKTSELPPQTYKLTLPITVLDPRDIEFSLEPASAILGEPVSVKFTLTEEICSALPADTADCLSADFSDALVDYADISILGQLFRLNWTQASEASAKNRQDWSVIDANTTLNHVSNTNYAENVSLEVIYQGGDADYVSAALNSTVGLKNSIIDPEFSDSDQDGIPDDDDAFPFDSSCSLVSEGVSDTNGDGQIDSNDNPVCTESIKPDDGETVYTISSEDEEWEIYPQSDFIYRSSLGDPSLALPPISFSNRFSEITAVADYPFSRHVIVGFADGTLNLFDYSSMRFEEYSSTAELGLDESSVSQIDVLDTLVLVHFGNGDIVLLDISGDLVELDSLSPYPRPGEKIQLRLSEGNISTVFESLDIQWNLDRFDGIGTYNTLTNLVSNQNGAQLLAGQTRKGELVTFVASVDMKEVFRKVIPVLGVGELVFQQNFYDESEDLRVISSGSDISELSNLDPDVDGYEFYVDWLVNGETENYGKRVLRSDTYPFQLPATNTQYGDIVQAKLYLSRTGESDDFLIKTLRMLVIGNPADFEPIVNILGVEPDLTVSVAPNTTNREFFDRYFSPVWYVDEVLISDEVETQFPAQDSSFNLKFGHKIEVSFDYDNGVLSSSTDLRLATVVDSLTANNEPYTLVPRNLTDATAIAVEFDTFSENSLEVFSPIWLVNGVQDKEATTFEYPVSNLSTGDRLQLKIVSGGGTDQTIEFGVSAGAELVAGYDLSGGSANSPDDDGDGVRNSLDYFRLDPGCSAETDGNPDDTDQDGLNDLFELNWGAPGFDSRISMNSADSDGDGLNDAFELDNGSSPGDPEDPNPTPDEDDPPPPPVDYDGDGLENDDELAIGTKVHVSDTDNDGLSDGFEFNTAGFDPLDPDSDDDGIPDGEDYRQEQAKMSSIVEPGHCYSSWIAQQDSVITAISDAEQTTDLGEQKVAFVVTEEQQSEIFIYDLAGEVYQSSIKMSVFDSEPSAVEFNTSDLDALYTAIEGGLVLELDLTDSQTPFDFATQRYFSIGSDDQVTQILDQGDLLLVESFSTNDDQYTIHLFEKPGLPGENLSSFTVTSPVSMALRAWRDSNKEQLWFLGESNGDERLFELELDLVTPVNTVLNEAPVPADIQPTAPFYFRNLTDQALVFSSGDRYDPALDSWEATEEQFALALEHEDHRVYIPENDTRLNVKSFPGGLESGYQRYQMVVGNNVFKLIPVGSDVVLMSSDSAGSRFMFERVQIGDSDVDGLPGWWEYYYGGGLGETLVAGDLFDGVNSYLDAYQNALDVARFLSDQDGDGIADANELCPDSECILTADQDGDFLLDGDEVLFGFDIDDPDFDDNGVLDGDEDSDGDNLSNRYELYVSGTDPTDTDTDGDGLDDDIEINIVLSNPLLGDSDSDTVSDADEDFDGDGLTNIIEVSFGTDPNNDDTDGDSVSDYDEANYDGDDTNLTGADLDPLNSDSDGDGIADNVEIALVALDPLSDDAALDPDGDLLSNALESLFGSDPLDDDTDDDGFDDREEFDGEGVDGFDGGTNPTLADTDGDGISDFDEINNFVGTDGDTNPVLADTDGDGLDDGVEVDGASAINGVLSHPGRIDTDSDGLTDFQEYEYSFIYSVEELELYRFPPGQPLVAANAKLVDTDGDGLTDQEEWNLGSNLAETDTDNDGLTDLDEREGNTQLRGWDSDGDGLSDGDEVNVLGTSPLDLDSDDNGINDGDEDADGDGLTNSQELYVTYTDPLSNDERGLLFNSGGNLVNSQGAIVFANADVLIAGAEGVIGGNIVDADDNVLLADGEYIVLGGNAILDPQEDPDADGLSNIEELTIGTQPYDKDTDGDGLTDGDEQAGGSNPVLEDSDGDGLPDLFELTPVVDGGSGTDPNNPDTDGDGLNDFQEISDGLDPNNVDTDGDLLADGDEPESADVFDRDGDSIADGIEVLVLGTSTENSSGLDSDEDGINDNVEIWVYVYDLNGDLVPEFNSRNDEPRWVPEQFDPNLVLTNPKTHDIQRIYYANGDVLGDLYIRKISDPLSEDGDGDGLDDDVELTAIEAYREDFVVGPLNFDLDLETGTLYSPSELNSDLFVLADPMNVNTNLDTDIATGKTVTDAQEDLDGDRLQNVDDLLVDGNYFTIRSADSDRNIVNAPVPDGLPDGIEVLLLGTDPLSEDSDEDNLTDSEELALDVAASEREVGDNESCADTELRLSNIAGRNYCYTVSYNSYPTDSDSDNDNVEDDVDAFPLDVNCSEARDGFDDAAGPICFSSWLAEQTATPMVDYLSETGPDFNEVALFDPSWDMVVRYDYSSGVNHYNDLVDGVEDVIAVEYSGVSDRLYMVNEGGNVSFIDPATYSSGDPLTDLLNNVPASGTVVAMAVAGSDVVLQVDRGGATDLYIYDNAGTQGTTLSDIDADIRHSLWNTADSRLYFYQQSNGASSATDVAYIEIAGGEFLGGMITSGFDFAGRDPSGALAMSQDGTDNSACLGLSCGSGFVIDYSI